MGFGRLLARRGDHFRSWQHEPDQLGRSSDVRVDRKWLDVRQNGAFDPERALALAQA
jgi:hypothetical protein